MEDLRRLLASEETWIQGSPETFQSILGVLDDLYPTRVVFSGALEQGLDAFESHQETLLVLVLTDTPSYKPETEAFLRVWRNHAGRRPRLLCMVNPEDREDRECPDYEALPRILQLGPYDPARVYHTGDPEDVRLSILLHIRTARLDPDTRIAVVRPDTPFDLPEDVLQIPETRISTTPVDLLIDPGIRTLSYQSIGGGLRQIEDTVGGCYLNPTRAVARWGTRVMILQSKERAGVAPQMVPYVGDVESWFDAPPAGAYDHLLRYEAPQTDLLGPLAQQALRALENPTRYEILLLAGVDTMSFEALPFPGDTLEQLEFAWVAHEAEEAVGWNQGLVEEWLFTADEICKEFGISEGDSAGEDSSRVRKVLESLVMVFLREDEWYVQGDLLLESSLDVPALYPLTVRNNKIQTYLYPGKGRI